MTIVPHTELRTSWDIDAIRADFPILKEKAHGKVLAYLDNAATTQKPETVIRAVDRYYRTMNSNIHRGVHVLSELATEQYELVRERVRSFIGAGDRAEIVFVRGTTEGINLVAGSFGSIAVQKGDEVLITGLEHHSNIVPWQMLCGRVGAKLRVGPLTDTGEVDMETFARLLGDKTRLVALAHVSNSLGTVNPVKTMISLAHERGIPVLVDGAQAVPHMRVDVKDLDADFYAFSGHKMFGPTGIGVLYAKRHLLESMPPYQGGGDMIKSVSFEKTVYNDIPYKFEAGTPNIAGVIGLGAAIEYLEGLDVQAMESYERGLLNEATSRLGEIGSVRIIGTAPEKAGVVSFVVGDIHPHDLGTILDREGIAVRTGHHCAQPVMERFNVPATVRASLAFYNTVDELERLAAAVRSAVKVFA